MLLYELQPVDNEVAQIAVKPVCERKKSVDNDISFCPLTRQRRDVR